MVSNPPFSILEPLIERLVKEKKIESCSFVIGEKYYQRCAAIKDRATRTSLMTQAFFDVELVSKINGDKFFPQSREESVIMKLLRKDKKKSDFGLRLLVSRMVNTPNESVVGLLRDIINEKVNLRTMDYQNIPTVKSLNVPETTLRKSLRDLDNMDINVLARAIGSLKKRFR
jgi:16S rRNA A1518/A1519 N6-dimethyltransferase RsmA/KsgA/DIM1 with predicted DNA glycosylase/AP lyase activity